MTPNIKILLGDDDPVFLELLPAQLASKDFHFTTAKNAKDVIDLSAAEEFDIILLDVGLPDASGVKILSKIREGENPPEVIMLTADTSVATGVEAMRQGAYDYITKPADPSKIEAVVRKAFEKKQLIKENTNLRVEVESRDEEDAEPFHISESMKDIFEQAEKIAVLDTTILITGESGTGKGILAKWIHRHSQRSEQPFITVNCGAFPESLFESEFFGHEKGSFTGANEQKVGLAEAADGSTLFLDEIGDMPLSMQVKLLHFLENGRIRRVGSTKDRLVDVRLVAATNQNLGDQIKSGRFRSDLFYRLNVIMFNIPAIRDRPEDIPILVDEFVAALKNRYSKPNLTLSKSARDRLVRHKWNGNVRELRNSLERTVALSKDDVVHEVYGLDTAIENNIDSEMASEIATLSLDEIEKRHILKVLSDNQGNREKAAAILGIASRTLYRKLKQYEAKST